MSSTTPLHTLSPARWRLFVMPREHGAWGLLLVPLVTGACAADPTRDAIVSVLLFAAVALGLFFLRTPVEAWLAVSPRHPQSPAERKVILSSIWLYSSVSGVALAILLGRTRAYGLLTLGAIAATAFLAQAILKSLGRETRMNAQLTGALALTSTAAGAYYLASGRLDRTALLLWVANWLFAANQIHYVQVRIHSARVATWAGKFARGRGFLIGEALTVLLLALAWRFGWLPGLVVLAFGPVLFRGLAWFLRPSHPLDVHRLGLGELLHALVFGALFIAGLHSLPL